MNRTLRVVHNGDYSDAFIVRINGTVGETVSFGNDFQFTHAKFFCNISDHDTVTYIQFSDRVIKGERT